MKMKSSVPSFLIAAAAIIVVFSLGTAARGTAAGAAAADFLWSKARLATFASFLNPDDAVFHFEIGNYYFGQKAYNTDKALMYYERSATLNPELPRLHYQTARIYFLKGEFRKAITEVNKEIALDPEFKKSYYLKGLIRGYAGNLDDAIENFKKFITLDPFNWAGHNDLAWIYFKKGDYSGAKKAALAGLTHAPENPWLNNALGLALLNLGEQATARERFAKALSTLSDMEPLDWGKAYPGNDPRIYAEGLREMKESVTYNLKLTETL